MLGILIFAGAALAIYAITQGFTGVQADAPCHCCSQTGETGMKMSYPDLVSLAQWAGFDDPNTAAAIALAESSGDTEAYNPETQDVPGKYNRASADDGLGSYGLWQIYLAAHPEYSAQDLQDANKNAQAAFNTWQSAGGFHPWSTFNNKKYLQYMPNCA